MLDGEGRGSGDRRCEVTRKQAILAILTLPAAAAASAPPTALEPPTLTPLPAKDELPVVSEGVPFSWHRPRPAILSVDLVDKDTEGFGVCEITVSYRGKSMTFSAKEIWEALQPIELTVDVRGGAK